MSVNGNGEVMLDANQPLDGQATLTIIVRVADREDGSHADGRCFDNFEVCDGGNGAGERVFAEQQRE